MQIFEKRNDDNYRRTPRCGYCRDQGHNKYQCPRVAEDWYYLKDYIIPIQFTKLVSSWFKQPKYWGEWYTTCRLIFNEQERRKKPSVRKIRTRATSKCGFCRGEGHSRRNCPEQKAFLAKCYKANENWRRATYKEIVTKHGICVGACIEVSKKNGWGKNDPIVSEIGLITSVNFDKLNVLAAKGGYYNGQGNPYYCPLKVMAMVDGKESEIKIRIDGRDNRYGREDFSAIELDHNIVQKSSAGYHDSWTMTKLMSPSEHPLDEKWVTDYRDAFDFLTKKKSKEKLDDDGITSLIEKWSKKD